MTVPTTLMLLIGRRRFFMSLLTQFHKRMKNWRFIILRHYIWIYPAIPYWLREPSEMLICYQRQLHQIQREMVWLRHFMKTERKFWKNNIWNRKMKNVGKKINSWNAILKGLLVPFFHDQSIQKRWWAH